MISIFWKEAFSPSGHCNFSVSEKMKRKRKRKKKETRDIMTLHFKTGSCDPQSPESWAFTDIIIHYRIPHHKKGLKLSGGISSNAEALRICWSSRQKWRRSKAMQDEEGAVGYVMQKYLKRGFCLQASCCIRKAERGFYGGIISVPWAAIFECPEVYLLSNPTYRLLLSSGSQYPTSLYP